MYLIFDCETTGFPTDNLPANSFKQARIVSFHALLVHPETLAIVSELGALLKCSKYGITIPEDAVKIHGIDTDTADKFGLERGAANVLLLELLEKATCFIAYNALFDLKMLGIELPTIKPNEVPRWCAMEGSNKYVSQKQDKSLPVKNRYKLSHAYNVLFGTPIPEQGAHSAKADCYATLSIAKYAKTMSELVWK